MPIEPYPGTQSVLRAVALLKTFSDSQPELSLTDLVSALDLNKTTVYRLLTALESEGMVARDPGTDAYRLGPEIIALGGRAMRSNPLRIVSRPMLERLSKLTGETATLEVLAGKNVLILDEVAGQYLLGTAPSIGTHWPAHATSTGKVLMAHLPEAQQQEGLEALLDPSTARALATLRALKEELSLVQLQGYAVAVEELEAGYVAIAAPVQRHDGQVVAAIGVGGPSSRLDASRIPDVVELVKASAAQISQDLGFRP
jgi:DNA-binding IclR family transcriptional regulator